MLGSNRFLTTWTFDISTFFHAAIALDDTNS